MCQTTSMAKKSHPRGRNHHTVLFKKLLSSFFSKESMMHIGMNPASIFVSFVSSRQFFGLINRRMTEHYKLNNLGINLESFDNKIWLGDNPTITVKNIDIYYAYNSSANFVWYKFYNPNTIATGLSMFFAAQSLDIFEETSEIHFSNFIYTIYLLCFVFIAHIKTFREDTSEEEQFDYFVSIFWEFYGLVFANTKQTLSAQDLHTIKLLLTEHLHIMFALFHSMKLLSTYFVTWHSAHKEIMERLLAWETQHHTKWQYVQDYLAGYDTLRNNTSFSDIEKKILDLLIPADISIKYLFGDQEWKLITQHIISTIYPAHTYQELLESFVKDWDRTQELIELSTDFENIKHTFFDGLQHYIKAKITLFANEASSWRDSEEDLEDALDEFLSQLSQGDELDLDNLPKNIQIQSITFDKLVNFYISFVGGLWIARGDSGYLRIAKSWLLDKLLQSYALFGSQHQTISSYMKFFQLYEKNVFYYQYVFNHIRSWKESFVLPSHGSSINHNSNVYIIQLLNEAHRASILQDISPSGIKLYIKKEDILEEFKSLFGGRISKRLQQTNEELIQDIYWRYDILTDSNKANLAQVMQEYVNTKDIERLKDRMYNIDFWIAEDYIDALMRSDISKHYDQSISLGIFATIKETLFGLLLYITYLQNSEESHQKDYSHDQFLDLYIYYLLGDTPETHQIFKDHITQLLTTYRDILSLWTLLDDNQDYMYIWFNNRTSWIKQQNINDLSNSLTSEDEIWLLGYLKHISYYNRRFLIPQP